MMDLTTITATRLEAAAEQDQQDLQNPMTYNMTTQLHLEVITMPKPMVTRIKETQEANLLLRVTTILATMAAMGREKKHIPVVTNLVTMLMRTVKEKR